MFRSRFSEAFSSKLGHFGPQDIERGVMDPVPSPQVETLLCALLALVLNRKKPIEYVKDFEARSLMKNTVASFVWSHKGTNC